VRSLLLASLIALAVGCKGKNDDTPSPSPGHSAPTPATGTDTAGPTDTHDSDPLTDSHTGTVNLPLFAAPPLLEVPTTPAGTIGGARRVSVSATASAELTVTVTGPEGSRSVTWPAATDHVVPLVGLRPDTDYIVQITLQPAADAAQTWPDLSVRGAPFPADGPELTVLPVDGGTPVEGYTLLTASSPTAPDGWALLLDDDAELIWWARLLVPPGDLRLTADGTLLTLGQAEIIEYDWLGEVLWHGSSIPNGSPGSLRLAVDGVHHEVVDLPDGTLLTLDTTVVEAPAFPVSYDEPTTFAPATIVSNGLVQLDRSGAELVRVDLDTVLPMSHIGFNSLDPTPVLALPDWAHANALVPDPSDGTWLVHLRHLDALVKVSPEGELRWILGDPAGWPAPQSDALLTPTGPLSWPYHAHAPQVHRDGDELTVVLFDNHNEGHTPYTAGPKAQPPSRVVAYRIDETQGTVEQLWEQTIDHEGPLYSFALGDADLLDDGTVLGVWGMLTEEDGQLNSDLGRGDLSARVVQVDPVSGERSFDLRIGSSRASSTRGFSVYRAERVPSLHPQLEP